MSRLKLALAGSASRASSERQWSLAPGSRRLGPSLLAADCDLRSNGVGRRRTTSGRARLDRWQLSCFRSRAAQASPPPSGLQRLGLSRRVLRDRVRWSSSLKPQWTGSRARTVDGNATTNLDLAGISHLEFRRSMPFYSFDFEEVCRGYLVKKPSYPLALSLIQLSLTAEHFRPWLGPAFDGRVF